MRMMIQNSVSKIARQAVTPVPPDARMPLRSISR
jgi:hypothetical protein